MKQLNFEGNLIFRWQESKRQFRERFWEEIRLEMRGQVKQIMEAMIQQEFNDRIGALPYERTPSRRTKRNGSYQRNLETPLGRIEGLVIPRARQLNIQYTLFDQWQQVEDSVLEAMLQAYLLGRSGACAQKIIQGFGHARFSRSFLQRLTHRFEENLRAWLHRPITKPWPYLFVDGMVVPVKEVYLQNWCVLWALGMDEEGGWEVLGFVVLKTESQEGAERLFQDLCRRGLEAPRLIIRDDSKALEKAAAMIFPHTPQQSCIFHKVQAAGRYLQNRQNREPFLREASDIYLQASGIRSLEKRLRNFTEKWLRQEPEAVRSLRRDFDQTSTYLAFPQAHWSRIRTNNPLERFIEEVRRWTHRFGYFQGRGNLYTALFTYLCHKNPELVSPVDPVPDPSKDTILIA